MLSLSLPEAADAKPVLLSTSIRRRYWSVQGAQFCDVLEFFHFKNDVLSGEVIILPDLLQAALMASCGLSNMLVLSFSIVSPACRISKLR